MPKVFKQFLLTVYDDGSFEMKEFVPDDRFSGCSASARQLACVLQYVSETKDLNVYKSITNGIRKVAADNNITVSTVHTKLTRHLSISMEEFRQMLENYISHTSNEFETVLINSCTGKTKAADEMVFKKVLKSL